MRWLFLKICCRTDKGMGGPFAGREDLIFLILTFQACIDKAEPPPYKKLCLIP